MATNNSGTLLNSQEFDPWGKVRLGAVSQTSLNYTGQRLDGSGLLYYHARYYDPNLGRFVSADTLVPGAASGKGGAAATLGYDSRVELRPLTVDDAPRHKAGEDAAQIRWFEFPGAAPIENVVAAIQSWEELGMRIRAKELRIAPTRK